ncbi:hypothetical protein [Phormidium sp. CCY1219]|uniref:hypothetical protein n=1 Tax=Phormidium sp. CCY1219 TaxID=2886104 RepID=UPI002D1F655E|nr:hypothetical protein [Phormidium sp. CCY1219]MEB3827380.1 hypothetical protein [Phormidium sp. CCY1219]
MERQISPLHQQPPHRASLHGIQVSILWVEFIFDRPLFASNSAIARRRATVRGRWSMLRFCPFHLYGCN